MPRFIQLTKMHFGPDSSLPADRRIWVAISHIQALQPAERNHLMHGIPMTYTYVYTTDSDDCSFTVTESPEEIFRLIDAVGA